VISRFEVLCSSWPPAVKLAVAGWWLVACLLGAWVQPARAGNVDLPLIETARTLEEGVQLSFTARFELPKAVEEALQKGIPLHFVAEAELYRYRWYWRDKRVANATRSWRLAYQPLTRRYKVSFGSLSQTYESLSEALASVQRVVRWRLADPLPAGDDNYYLEFNYRLDTTQLPRPLQIGVGGQADWDLSVERKLPVPEVAVR
jgi:hypothetical protein